MGEDCDVGTALEGEAALSRDEMANQE